LKSQSILDEVVHHEFIPQIWCNELIRNIINNYEPMSNEMVMNQLIPFYKSNKKVKSEKMMDYFIP
jgi:predicted Mrr-cat superfamily restriction endonuclease